MQAIEQHPYVEQVTAALSAGGGVGEPIEDEPALEFIENEIMKVGSLAHSAIEWPRVEQESLRLLAEHSKDLKILGYLLLCLQRGGNGERFALSLYLLHRVLDGWWEQAWPWPGHRGRRARGKLFAQIMRRAGGETSALSFDGSVGDGRSYSLELLDRLQQQAGARELPDDGLQSLWRAVERVPPASQGRAGGTDQDTASSPDPEPDSSASASKPRPSLGGVTLDPGNERATRQSLLQVADLLTEMSPAEPLGYQLRRYALWYTIAATPPTRDGTRTDLAAVSADRVAEYREALAREPSHGLWSRIEQSLSVSPFWFEGHCLSAQTAAALGCGACTEAIRNALKGFLERLPDLARLTFSNGTPFLPATVEDWLMAAGPASGSGAGEHWEQAYEQAREELANQGLAPAMQRLEQGLSEAREPRDRFYWRLMSVNLLQESGLASLARQQFQDLREQTRGLTLEHWEPALMARLERQA